MPRASVGVGPVRVGSGCCIALVMPALIAVVIGALVLCGAAIANTPRAVSAAVKHSHKHKHHKIVPPKIEKEWAQPTTDLLLGYASRYNPDAWQNPKPIYVDDPSITITWTVEHTLNKGLHWGAELKVPEREKGIECTNRGKGSSNYRNTRRGERASITIYPEPTYYEWCAGRILIGIYVTGRHNNAGEPFLELESRIYNRP